ncbi:hypothetical protein PUNSTDRAFT_146657 [Punctularia strigosozonata HHB-11173 SS5]|uniref:Uncharacterized protein n=1 Tax=Punctularia strigosozonata (strain HHB-11173) TaxID=741275 RepID=R7S2U6_PUNST|nr:uncharacterized protein PUNSTDRAFT_146657 [Punctularia strigosozonata HHB-11173 SS5]EIN04169.1 hypothetical protein PUNSTDRAFT_146657 [Punctularia strigosozonata HHB-11173 SS5]
MRPRKRAREPPTVEERPVKRRRTSGLKKMCGEIESARRIISETDEDLSRVLAKARTFLEDIEHLNVQREERLAVSDGSEIGCDSPALSDGSVPRPHADASSDENPLSNLKPVMDTLERIHHVVTSDILTHSMNEDVRDLYNLYNDLSDEAPACHDCRRNDLQHQRLEAEWSRHPRPRMGVDAQGWHFEDWDACMPGTRPLRRTLKESRMMDRLCIPENREVSSDVLVVPARLEPRRPRVLARQFKFQFHHIPGGVYNALERWHIDYGRCLDCLVRAMRTFPSWIIEQSTDWGCENGNPVFMNNLADEVAEWDEDHRRWRHLILDHHRWIDAEDLEGRDTDSLADPKVVNGTIGKPIPFENR